MKSEIPSPLVWGKITRREYTINSASFGRYEQRRVSPFGQELIDWITDYFEGLTNVLFWR